MDYIESNSDFRFIRAVPVLKWVEFGVLQAKSVLCLCWFGILYTVWKN